MKQLERQGAVASTTAATWNSGCFCHVAVIHTAELVFLTSEVWHRSSQVFPCLIYESTINVQNPYLGILWKSSCTLATILWLPCLNQCECICGREPPASLGTAAAFIVYFCGQIQEFAASSVTCKSEGCVCVCSEKSSIPSCRSLIHECFPSSKCMCKSLGLCVAVWHI